MQELEDRFEEAFREEAEQTIGQIEDENFADIFGGGVLDDAVEAKVDERFNRILPEIADTSRDSLRETIVEGLDEGINPRNIATEIADLPEFGPNRAELVARTEMLAASNAGTHTAHSESDVVEFRGWLHTRDPGNPDHRPSHLAEDRRTRTEPVRVDEPFKIAGFQPMYPGDFGVPGHDCNCRCTTISKFPDEKRSSQERRRIWKQFDKRLTAREERTRETVQAVFADQRDRVLATFADTFDVELEEVA